MLARSFRLVYNAILIDSARQRQNLVVHVQIWRMALFKKTIFALGALLVTASAANAYEERWPKWYIGVSGSLPWVSDDGVSVAGTSAGSLEFDNPGWGAGVSLGYKPGGTDSFLDMMRFELEYAYRHNDLDTLAGTPVADDISVHAYMFNALVDIPTDTQFTPYLGAGLGWASAEMNLTPLGVSDTDTKFAYQGMLGVAYEPETIPNVAFSVGYRYFGMASPGYRNAAGLAVENDYDSHNAEVGARFSF